MQESENSVMFKQKTANSVTLLRNSLQFRRNRPKTNNDSSARYAGLLIAVAAHFSESVFSPIQITLTSFKGFCLNANFSFSN